MDKIDVSVQIANYNSGERIIKTLDALVDSISGGLPYEIIIVDNASRDNSVALIKERYPDIHLIENSENRFFSPAHNQACSVAKGKYILILNSDITFTAGVLGKLYSYLEENPGAGGVSPGLYYSDNRSRMACLTWEKPSLLRDIPRKLPQGWVLSRCKLLSSTIAKKIDADCECRVEVVSDACLLIRRDLFKTIGGYDENMLLYHTEDDLCIRIREKGYNIAILPYLRVFHDHGYSTKRVAKLFLRKIVWNDSYEFYKKNRSRLSAIIINVFCAIDYGSLFLKEKIRKFIRSF